jgi:hypothetical protein
LPSLLKSSLWDEANGQNADFDFPLKTRDIVQCCFDHKVELFAWYGAELVGERLAKVSTIYAFANINLV